MTYKDIYIIILISSAYKTFMPTLSAAQHKQTSHLFLKVCFHSNDYNADPRTKHRCRISFGHESTYLHTAKISNSMHVPLFSFSTRHELDIFLIVAIVQILYHSIVLLNVLRLTHTVFGVLPGIIAGI